MIKSPRIIITALMLILVSSCTSVKEFPKYNSVAEIPVSNPKLKTLTFKAVVSIDSPDGSNSVTARFSIAETDSMLVKLSGPFGISVAQMYADPKTFLFYNIFQSEVLEGRPSAINMQKAMRIPLSYSDFVRLLRAEVPSGNARYSRDESDKQNIFSNFSNPDYDEHLTLSPDGMTIVRYQRKISGGAIIVDVSYKNYKNYNGIYLPNQMTFSFPEAETKVAIDVNNYEINKTFEKPFRFQIPKSIKRYRLD